MSWPQVATICGSVLLAAGGIGAYWLNDIKSDVRELRASQDDAVKARAALGQALNESGLTLTVKIHETRDIVGRNETKLDAVAADVRDLKADMRVVTGAIGDLRGDMKVLMDRVPAR